MAKNKPQVAFLEALQHEKKRRGEEAKPGGGFKTPDWFFNQSETKPASPNSPAAIGLMHSQPSRKFRPNPRLIAAGSAALILILGITWWYTHHNSSRLQLTDKTTDEIRQDGPKADVTEVQTNHPAGNPSPVAPPITPVPSTNPPVAPAANGTVTRTIGLNYIVAQSYSDEKTAREAADFLDKNSVPCTVEHGLSYAPKFYCVLTTTGFPKITTADYLEYKKKIDALGVKFASTSKTPKWARFQPNPFRWK